MLFSYDHLSVKYLLMKQTSFFKYADHPDCLHFLQYNLESETMIGGAACPAKEYCTMEGCISDGEGTT